MPTKNSKKANDEKVEKVLKEKQGPKVGEKAKKDNKTNEKEKKRNAFITRAIWSVVLIAMFLVVILSGNFPLILFVYLCQVLTFKEIIRLTAGPAQDKNIPYNKLINWYLLISTIYYLDGESLFNYLEDSLVSNKVLSILAIHHMLISYALYIVGFIFFVTTLKKGYLKFQFSLLCITHMTLLLVVYQSHLIIDNILTGIFWFLLPASLVIVNDIFAYLFGITVGRTKLIDISPKKTVEGFVGAWISTGVASLLLTSILSKFNYLICPVSGLFAHAGSPIKCDPNSVFVAQVYQLPAYIAENIGIETISFKPVYVHALVLSAFASLIAPFGGFFASGLKRAFGIKDFGDTIPGHGGITDRLDCQFLMGSFSYFYIHTFVSLNHVTVRSVVQLALVNLSAPQIFQLIKALLKYLNNVGYLDDGDLRHVYKTLENTVDIS